MATLTQAAGPTSPAAGAASSGGSASSPALTTLASAVDGVVARELESMRARELDEEMVVIEREARRLTARRTAAASEVARRAREAASAARPNDPRAEERAERDAQRRMASRLGLPPGELRRARRTERELQGLPDTSQAQSNGEISAAHAAVIADAVADLDGELRERVAAELTEAARRLDPVALGKKARLLLATLAPEVFERHGRQRHARRSGRMATAPDGMFELHLRCSGIDAETAATAVHAFRRPDRAGEPVRTTEQATADAIVAALKAGLDASKAPTDHGVRPHVSLVLQGRAREASTPDDGDPCDGETDKKTRFVGIGSWVGPIPFDELSRMLPTATVTRILADEVGRPLDVTDTSRNCPTAIWRALCVRDVTCRWPGCDMPAIWCQAAHGATPWRRQQRWSLEDSCLLCTRHHRTVDNDGWRIEIEDLTVRFHPPAGGPPIVSERAPP